MADDAATGEGNVEVAPPTEGELKPLPDAAVANSSAAPAAPGNHKDLTEGAGK
jgi:hypothetical protein